jgi:hypothetical protein
VLNIFFFLNENVAVLRRVNKANNPACQGRANELRDQQTGKKNPTPEKKKDFSDLFT